MAKHSKYQQKIIKNYYENRETIALQRVQELVTELYLSSGTKRRRYWEQIASHLSALGIKQTQIDHIVKQDRPELVVSIVEKLV